MPYGEIRIIAGHLRGRKVKVVDLPELRPTPDRVRERVFSWLMPSIHNAVCLDLFAGTGVLALESLSRGAQRAVAIDNSAIATTALASAGEQLGVAASLRILQASLPAGLSLVSEKFNLVFIDPPYQSNLLFPTIEALNQQRCLQHNAVIYIESNRYITATELPNNWLPLKSAHIGQVFHQLLRFEGNEHE